MRLRTLTVTITITITITITVAVAVLVAACGQSSESPSSARRDPDASGTASPAGLIARADDHLTVFDQPGDHEPATTLAPTTEFGSPTTLLVTERDGDWLRVLLPVRPNDASGWVRAADVSLQRTTYTIDVDLPTATLRVLDGTAVVVETPVAVGKPDAPTPTGRFSVTDVLDTPGDGPYGPYALGLSGHSDVLTEFAGGDGRIGIHGTDDPASIGRAVSHGCVRVPNDVITQLAGMLPLGTPVVIR